MKRNDLELEQVVHTHHAEYWRGWLRWFSALNPNPNSWSTSVSVGSSPRRTHSLPQRKRRIESYPPDVTIHFQNLRGAASARCRNNAGITALMCEQKIWFCAGARFLKVLFFLGWLFHFKGLFIPVWREIHRSKHVTSWQLTNRTVSDISPRSRHSKCQSFFPRVNL